MPAQRRRRRRTDRLSISRLTSSAQNALALIEHEPGISVEDLSTASASASAAPGSSSPSCNTAASASTATSPPSAAAERLVGNDLMNALVGYPRQPRNLPHG